MLFILYGSTARIGAESRRFFIEHGISVITKYHYIGDESPELTTFFDPRNYCDLDTFNTYTDPVFRYWVGNIHTGFSASQIKEAVTDKRDYLLTLSTDRIDIIRYLKTNYKGKVKAIYISISENILKMLMNELDVSSKELDLRLGIRRSLKRCFDENQELFDRVLICNDPDSDMSCANLFDKYRRFISYEEYKNNGFENLIQMIEEIREQTKILPLINSKLEEISNKIDYILSYIKTRKAEQPNEEVFKALTEDLEDELCARFANTISDYINDRIDYNDRRIEIETAYLQGRFGKYWNSLDAYTQKSLVSARVLYSICSNTFTGIDFSGVVITATTALENELKLRFFYGYQSYLQERFGNPSEEYWPKVLLYINRGIIIKSSVFELGALPYIVGEKAFISDAQAQERDMFIRSIIKDPQIKPLGIKALIEPLPNSNYSIIKRCEDIRIKYRNPAAHTMPVEFDSAKKCCNQICNAVIAADRIDEIDGLILDIVRTFDVYTYTNS